VQCERTSPEEPDALVVGRVEPEHALEERLGLLESAEPSEAMAEALYARRKGGLSIGSRPPYAEQESEGLGDDVIARLNPKTGDVESLEVLFFSTRLLRSDLFELPVTADLHRAG
jgi:hypothetical protein